MRLFPESLTWPAARRSRRSLLFAAWWALAGSGAPAAEVAIALSTASGLKFEPARLVVEPGAQVTLTFQNPDDMMHNFVLVKPGARLAVVEAALALADQGPARNFVPASDLVLWSTPLLNPGQSTRLTFTAPATEGVYPYVCTFPGHGLVMYGALYVARSPRLPPLDQDPNLPPPVVAVAAAALQHPTVQRTFLPDCGPAALAIGLPGGQSYSFDAGQCRLRYIWRGGFLDNSPQVLGKGDQFARPLGRVYYRASSAARLRIGDPSAPPKVKWQGYRWVGGVPRLSYQLDGAAVAETPQLNSDGQALVIAYEIEHATGPVTFTADPEGGASVTSDAGAWSGDRLTLTPGEARRFTLTFTERPGIEPLAYWSMNDLLFTGRKDPLPGVVGRAFTPGGNFNRREVLDTGIPLSAVQHGGTLMSWVKRTPPAATGKADRESAAPIFSAGTGSNAFVIRAPRSDLDWHHLAACFHHGGYTLYVDGQVQGELKVSPADPAAPLCLGSVGKEDFFAGLLDEVRIFDRPLSAAEIEKIYRREKPTTTPSTPRTVQNSPSTAAEHAAHP